MSNDVVILNRKMIWNGGEMWYGADERHANYIRGEVCIVEDARGLGRPFAREAGVEDDSDISARETTRIRTLVATANHLAADWPEIQLGSRRCAARLPRPRRAAWRGSRGWRVASRSTRSWCGTSAAGRGSATMPSTCSRTVIGRMAPAAAGPQMGGNRFHGVAIKQSSSMQASAALPIGEAEYLSLVRAAVPIGVHALPRDLRWKYAVVLPTELPTARGVASGASSGRRRAHSKWAFLLGDIAVDRESRPGAPPPPPTAADLTAQIPE